jgi:acyl-CoA dehydrogenase
VNFSLSADQEAIREAIAKVCAAFGDDYWLARDRDGGFPHDFHQAFAKDGWLGICMPEEFGGAALGITEAAIMMQAVSESGAGPERRFRDPHEHLRVEPGGRVRQRGAEEAFPAAPHRGRREGVLRGDRALTRDSTPRSSRRAPTARGDHYVVSGAKVWISTAQVAEKMLLLARTTPLEEVKKPTQGLSLFYTNLDRRFVEVREIEKMGRKAVDSNQVFIDGLEVPVEDRIGEEGRGFEYILHGMNPERILIAAEGIGLGKAALRRATQYAKERIVFDRPIGKNQAIQHPLAQCWMELEAANLMVFKAASLYDAGSPAAPKRMPRSTSRARPASTRARRLS